MKAKNDTKTAIQETTNIKTNQTLV